MADALSQADVERIAALARLALTEDEKILYARQLTRILEFARQIADLDTRDIPPTASVLEQESLERADCERPSLPRNDALANAPDAAAGLFRVPRVLGDGA
ncbi:MAG TPA: Asp-tRNA(Asn)/Glu-tRNA(Gln) amidotransferase subunit GatC [Vicinamibacterales bacterium]|jgi:aspartyl-tRNA(Asn)/glutamyl-tRNA(Gln) amidotransferase subunit C